MHADLICLDGVDRGDGGTLSQRLPPELVCIGIQHPSRHSRHCAANSSPPEVDSVTQEEDPDCRHVLCWVVVSIPPPIKRWLGLPLLTHVS